MKFMQKTLCTLVTLAILLSSVAFAQEDIEYIDTTDMKMFTVKDTSLKLMDVGISEQDVAVLEIIMDHISKRNSSISIPSEYAVTAEQFEYIVQLIPSYINTYYPELFYADTQSIVPYEENGYVTGFSMNFHSPVSAGEIKLVNDILTEMQSLNPEIRLHAADYGITDVSRLSYIINNCLGHCMQFDYSDMFYADLAATGFAVAGTEGNFDVIVTPSYMSGAEIAIVTAALVVEKMNVSELISNDMTTEEKVLAVHDYIAKNYSYDFTYESRTLSDMVIRKNGVCQGYSYLFKYLLEAQGIECIHVPSNATSHMWSKVNIDGEWYNVDVTHDDGIISSQISHSHFLLSDHEIIALEDASHVMWNKYQWDGMTHSEEATSDRFSTSVMSEISGPAAFTNDAIYAFDLSNNIVQVNADSNTLDVLYTDSAEYMWKPYGVDDQMYGETFGTLVRYRNSLYFNSPDKVYRFNTSDNTAEVVYEYTEITDISETYLYGLTVNSNKLYAEYSTTPNSTEKLIEINTKNDRPDNKPSEPTVEPTIDPTIEPTAEPTPLPTPEPLPELVETEQNEETGEITIQVTIPEEIVEKVETVKVFVAEYAEDGTLIGIIEREQNADEVTFEPQEECNSVKTFVWSADGSPLSVADIFSLYK